MNTQVKINGVPLETSPTCYLFKHREGLYLVRVVPDIACRGGKAGKGTRTYINRICADGETLELDMRGYQGRHSKAGIIRVIKANGWDKVSA